jgi:Thioredoxin-related protein
MRKFLKTSIFIIGIGLLIASCSKQNGVNEYLKSSSSKNVPIVSLIPSKDYEMLIIESSDCPYCHKLQHDITTNPELIKALKNVEVAPVLADDTSKLYKLVINNHKLIGTGEDIASDLGVNAYPNIFFLNKEGKVILNVPGYVKPKTMVCVINFITTKSYKKEDINSYIKANNCLS